MLIDGRHRLQNAETHEITEPQPKTDTAGPETFQNKTKQKKTPSKIKIKRSLSHTVFLCVRVLCCCCFMYKRARALINSEEMISS